MPALFVLVPMLVFFGLGYRLYGSFVERRVVEPSDDRPTPAVAVNDGVDYCPAHPMVLFGHHFSSIAGTGPIVGPILGVAFFGWAAVLGWIALGSLFMGAVHDYLSLMISVRRRGSTITEVAESVIGRRARHLLSAFVWLALVFIVAFFGTSAASTFILTPEIVLPVFGILPIAILFGYASSGRRLPPALVVVLAGTVVGLLVWVGLQPHVPLEGIFIGLVPILGLFLYSATGRRLSLLWSTTFAVLALGFLMWLGDKVPIILPGGLPDAQQIAVWYWIVMAYCLLASSLPVWFLLQPRDYISTYQLFGGLGIGILAVFAWGLGRGLTIHAPQFTGFHAAVNGGGILWPMLFVWVACGAISGFHTLVASGTTSKQLSRERHGRPIAFGGMLLEGLLATISLLAVTAGLGWAGRGNGFLLGILDPAHGGDLKNWMIAFKEGYGNLASGLGIPALYGGMFALLVVNTFILTTLDTSTRLGRYIVEESLGPFHSVFRNHWAATLLTILAAAYIGLTGKVAEIVPIFGAANQLMAALALLVISCYLVGVRKPSRYALIPAVFMLATTMGALIYKGVEWVLAPSPNWVVVICDFVLLILAIMVALEAGGVLWRLMGTQRAPSPEPAAQVISPEGGVGS